MATDRFRPSYRFICYNLHLLGRSINSDLRGDDRPELVAALYAEADAWLSAAGARSAG
ncbi:MAG TPA: hypothetical protein VFA49_12745 [Chloroflexota bacterium]|jgi:hypothetical protein|nr:hypothetical protein [Chloroflexota bacterium]